MGHGAAACESLQGWPTVELTAKAGPPAAPAGAWKAQGQGPDWQLAVPNKAACDELRYEETDDETLYGLPSASCSFSTYNDAVGVDGVASISSSFTHPCMPMEEARLADSVQSSPGNRHATDPQQFFSRVRVAVRVRPSPAAAAVTADGQQAAMRLQALSIDEAGHVISIHSADGGKADKRHTFDWALGPEASQVQVYDCCVHGLVERFLEGYNATLLAYGQTASGKTHTMGMAGLPEEPSLAGILPRVAAATFAHMTRHTHGGSSYALEVQFLEVYQEDLLDLLCEEHQHRDGIIVRKGEHGEVVPHNAVSKPVADFSQLMATFESGVQWRSVGATKMNDRSSRSHAIFTLLLTHTWTDQRGRRLRTRSKLHLVDLAGSERQRRTGAEGQRLKESSNINTGLLALGKVVSALAKCDSEADTRVHVPVRDSKLTRLLADSLGGTAATVMIACVAPDEANVDESLDTLLFASRARQIKSRQEVRTEFVQEPLPAGALLVGREPVYPLTAQEHLYQRVASLVLAAGSTATPTDLLNCLTQEEFWGILTAHRQGRNHHLLQMRTSAVVQSQDLMLALLHEVHGAGTEDMLVSARSARRTGRDSPLSRFQIENRRRDMQLLDEAAAPPAAVAPKQPKWLWSCLGR